MKFLSTWRRNRAAKAYARKLGPWLTQNFGSGGAYTRQQIDRGIDELNLDRRHVVFAYAAFLGKEHFDSLFETLPVQISYPEARDLVERYQPARTRASGSREDHGVGYGSHWGSGGGNGE